MSDPFVVVWVDAWFVIDAQESYAEDFEVSTVGYLVEQTPEWVRIAGERTPQGYRAVTSIPMSAVRSIRPL